MMENRLEPDFDPDISHKQEIDSDAFADVHEVILKKNVIEATNVPSNYSRGSIFSTDT